MALAGQDGGNSIGRSSEVTRRSGRRCVAITIIAGKYGKSILDETLDMDREKEGRFICPECESTASPICTMCVEPVREQNSDGTRDPWGSIMQIDVCGACRFHIPAHLGKRWDDQTVEEARLEWQTVYRSTADREPDDDF